MSVTSTHLGLPHLLAAQAQKHVTHNEAQRLLDAMVSCLSSTAPRTTPPASPADGERHLVASGATGLWAGWDLNVTFWVDGVWMRLVPRQGWLVWIAAEQAFAGWNGTAWDPVGAPQDVSDAIFSLVNDADPTKSALFSLSGIPPHDADLHAAEHLQRTGDPRGHAVLLRQQDLLRSADGLRNRDGIGRLGLHRHGDDDRHLRHGHWGHDHPRHQDREPWHRGASGSTTVVNIGADTAGAGGTTVVNTPTVTFANAVTQVGMPQANLTAQLMGLGGATADSYNRVSVNTPALLFNNAGAGIEATVNKAASWNDATFAFKTGFSARALIGLLGNDDFSFKVSPDGEAFFDALKIDRLSGRVELPEPVVMPGLASIPASLPAGKLALYARDRAGAGWLDVQRPSGRFSPCSLISV